MKIHLQNQYLVLLRGINVGGNNIIKMMDLKNSFEEMGLERVKTYIQSGNVLFYSKENNKEKLLTKIEKTLSKRFNYNSRNVILTQKQLKQIIEKAPSGFGKNPGEYRYNVIFLKEPLSSKEALEKISVKEGVDNVFAGKDALYFSILISKAAQSRISRIITLPIYKNITIRNWNTTTKLYDLMIERENDYVK